MEKQPNQHPDSASDPRAEKINSIWKVVSLIYILLALGLTMYWEFRDEGLPRLVCKYQAQLFHSDSCYVALNFLVTLFAFIIPMLVVKFVVEKITGVKIETPTYTRPGSGRNE